MFKSFFSSLILLVFLSNTSWAADRQDIYQQALIQTEELISVLSGRTNEISMRDQAVITAEALKQLAFSEADSRKKDKIDLPLGFNQIDLESTLDLLDQKPGKIVKISAVPNDWFTGYLEKAENEIHLMIKEMDAGDLTSSEKYLLQAQQANKYLELMVKPPQS